MVEAMAQERGLIATFMPKPFAHLTGNGCHMHMSLWDGDTNVMYEDPKKDSRGMGMSEKGYHFIGGLKKHAKSYIAVTAPTVGSYKRLVIGAPTSGATWAPAYVTYGWNNRTMMLRIPDHGRIEDRTVDGACNPYLAATVVLAAGLDGIENGIDPGDPSSGSMYETSVEDRKKMGVETLPANLLDATRELEQNEVMRKALGSVGDEDYVDYFIRCKRREWQQGHEQITKWEIDRYLQLS
jgi:glutamine synthetase